jgi:hypothetical protein
MLSDTIKQNLSELIGNHINYDKFDKPLNIALNRFLKYRHNIIIHQYHLDDEQIDIYIQQCVSLIIISILVMKYPNHTDKLNAIAIDHDQNYNDVIIYLMNIDHESLISIIDKFMSLCQPDKLCLTQDTSFRSLVIGTTPSAFQLYMLYFIHDRSNVIYTYQSYKDYVNRRLDEGHGNTITKNEKNNLISLYQKYGQIYEMDDTMNEIYLLCCSYVIERNDPRKIKSWFDKYPYHHDQFIYSSDQDYSIDTLIELSKHVDLNTIRIIPELKHNITFYHSRSLLENELVEDSYSMKKLTFLLSHIDVNETTFPLFRAITEDDMDLLLMLSEYNVNLNMRDSQGDTTLFHACSNNNIYIAEYLFNRGVKIDFDPDIMDSDAKTWSYNKLIEYYYMIESPRYNKNIQFLRSCANGHGDEVKYLTKKK